MRLPLGVSVRIIPERISKGEKSGEDLPCTGCSTWQENLPAYRHSPSPPLFPCLATRGELLCFTAWRTKTSEPRGKSSYTPLFCWGMCHNNEKFNYLENYPLLIKLKVKALPTSPPLRPRWFLLPVPASEGQLALNLEPYRFTQFPIIPSNNL